MMSEMTRHEKSNATVARGGEWFEPPPGPPSEFEPTLIATSDNVSVRIDNVFNW